MHRKDIDKALREKCAEVGIPPHMIHQQESPARYRVLVGNEVHELEISTRITKRKLDENLQDLEFLAKRQRQVREQRQQRLAAQIATVEGAMK